VSADSKPGSKPALILFDLDDTLFAHRKAVDDGITAYVHALGGPYVPDAAANIATWHELEERHYHSYLGGQLDYQGQRRARARDFALGYGVVLDDEAAAAWFAGYHDHYVDSWVLHDDALSALDALRASDPRVRIGLITNGDEAFQRRKIERIGLAPYFENVVTSGALGIAKPDARIFEHACALFGVSPAAAAYVGDRLATDALGAARAGLTGVWLDRTGAAVDPELDAEADALGVIRIRSLAELPVALGF
jgi:putative hydrolase of the HAD superfamily